MSFQTTAHFSYFLILHFRDFLLHLGHWGNIFFSIFPLSWGILLKKFYVHLTKYTFFFKRNLKICKRYSRLTAHLRWILAIFSKKLYIYIFYTYWISLNLIWQRKYIQIKIDLSKWLDILESVKNFFKNIFFIADFVLWLFLCEIYLKIFIFWPCFIGRTFQNEIKN